MALTPFEHTKHKAMWQRISERVSNYIQDNVINTEYDAIITVDCLKYEVLQELYPDEPLPLAYCFACSYGWARIAEQKETEDKRFRCLYCPLEDWEADNCYSSLKIITPSTGLFQQFCQAVRYKNGVKAQELALKIKELPVKEGVTVI